MNAYKCDICGKYFEESKQKTGSKYSTYSEDTGHHQLYLHLKPKTDNDAWELFTGDICPDCMGYFCVGLVERGCQSEKVKMYAADHIRKAREEMCTKTLGTPVEEEAAENGTTE